MRSASRVAALYDIHGNLPALLAVLDDIRKAEVDLVVVGGDVLPGPMGTASLEALSALDVRMECIHGNGERIVLAEIAGGDISEVPEGYRGVIRWDAARVTPRASRVGFGLAADVPRGGPRDRRGGLLPRHPGERS